MVTYGVAESSIELKQILDLQHRNLPTNITKEEAREQGFVTVEHDLELLTEMNSPHPHIVARHDKKIIAYALVMLQKMEAKIPILVPMFEQINQIFYQGTLLRDAKYFIMGQICIDKTFRGMGVFRGLYNEMSKRMSPHFEYIITEVAKRNQRSLKAHYKVGFKNIKEYQSDEGEDWVIVLLDI
jgi:predicted GNAT family N-acyltransferase